ncbi:pH regulation protein F [Zobellella denitrificans]|uniref:monovalent cation/H+ antiporter complex subunit F n=1 Tax=Zobellella denitrificans TaxID=347534 RepID=UPI000B8BBD2B|nr:monovalent cation/H+ antiporter complex subunit F [Zobellella denitrificans]OXS14372.1 pH regulation protein F [Zobellella denitrificans]
MAAVLSLVAGLLLLSLLLGLWRGWRGPAAADRMLAAQLFGTTGIGLLLVLAEAMNEPALRDVALVLAVLAILATVAFVTRVVRIDRARTGKGGNDHDAP